jgi:hypothetical protein
MGDVYDLVSIYRVQRRLRLDLHELGVNPEECNGHDHPDDRQWCVHESIREALQAKYGAAIPRGEEIECEMEMDYIDESWGDDDETP